VRLVGLLPIAVLGMSQPFLRDLPRLLEETERSLRAGDRAVHLRGHGGLIGEGALDPFREPLHEVSDSQIAPALEELGRLDRIEQERVRGAQLPGFPLRMGQCGGGVPLLDLEVLQRLLGSPLLLEGCGVGLSRLEPAPGGRRRATQHGEQNGRRRAHRHPVSNDELSQQIERAGWGREDGVPRSKSDEVLREVDDARIASTRIPLQGALENPRKLSGLVRGQLDPHVARQPVDGIGDG